MRRLLREPLLHFLLLGGAFFAAHSLLRREDPPRPDEIVISAGQIEHIAADFAAQERRPPTPEELRALVDERVREEILSREAIRLSLDEDDAIIRKRLRQKMEAVGADLASEGEPGDAELAAWLAEHGDSFREDPRFTFRHVYLDPGKRGERIESDAAALLAVLRERGEKADAAALGDAFLLPHEFADQPRMGIGALFGPDFAAALGDLPTGRWEGPLRSGYGLHLVLLAARTGGRLPPLHEIREAVHRDLVGQRRADALRRFLEGLRARYEVRVEWPAEEAGRR